MAFDPDAYLAETEPEEVTADFDPDSYLQETEEGTFDPNAYLAESEEPSAGDIVKGVGTEVASGIGGSLVGGVIGGALGSVVPVVGTAAGAVAGSVVGGATASFFGSLLAQEIEGQDEPSMGRAIAAAAIGAVPGGVGKGVKGAMSIGKVATREATKGAAFGATEATARAVVDEGRLPTTEELAKYGGAGALFGGVLGGVTSKVGQKFAGKTPQEIDRAVARGDITFKEIKPFANQAQKLQPNKKSPPPIPETRGQGQQFHGTSGNISETGIISDTYSSDNIYGQGFYTTDAVDIAKGYTKKGLGENAVIYQITEKSPVKFLNIDEVSARQLALDSDTVSMPEIQDALDDLPQKATGTDLYDWIRRNVELPKDEIQEVFQSIQDGIARKGFGGITHVGGKLTKQNPHTVKIYFDPKNQIEVSEYMRFDVPELTQLKRAEIRNRKARSELPFNNKEAFEEWKRQRNRILSRIEELEKPKPTMEGIVRRSMEETKVKARGEAAAEALSAPRNLGTIGKILASVAPSRFVGTKAQQATIDFKRTIKAAEEISEKVGRKVQRAIKKNPTLETPINKFLDTGEMSPEVYDVLGADLQKYDDARQALQREAIQLLDDGAYKSLDDEARAQLKQKITDTMTGSQRYARREYRAFLDPEYKPSASEREAAKLELTDSYFNRNGGDLKAAKVSAESHLQRLENSFASTRKEDPRQFFGGGVDSVFKRRHNPGEAEMKYLGIVRDPVERMKGTLTGIARSISRERTNLVLQKELVDAGVASTTKLDDEMVELVLRGTGAEGTGLYGYPQVQTALNELYVGNASDKIDNIFLNGLQDLYRGSVGLSKGVKVLLNTVAYPVQVYGNTTNLLGMGINPFAKAGRGLRLALADAPIVSRLLEGVENTPAARRALLDELDDMAKYGIKNGNVLDSDIRATLNDGPFSKWLQKGLDPFGRAYQVPDVLGRYVGWKANQKTLRKLFPSASEDVIKRQAASMINDTYQNYDKLSNVVRTLSRWGVMPQFASFTAEFMRNQYNQGRMIARMLKGSFGSEFADELGVANMARMRAEGTKRLASLLGVYGGTYAAIEGVKAASNVDEKTESDLRDLVYAPWDKDRSQMVKLDEDGKSGWVANPSYVVPHAMGLSALKAGLRGDDEQSLVGLLADEMVGEGSFVFQEAYRALANQDERGKEISNQLDDLKNAQERMTYFIQEAFKPGFSRELEKLKDARLGKGDLTLKEVGARQLGARLNPFNVEEAAMFTVRNTNELATNAKSEYTSLLKYGEPSDQELAQAYEKANGIYQDAFQALRRNYESMKNPKFGFTEDKIIETFKKGGLSSKRILEVITNTPNDLPRTTKPSTSEIYNEMGQTMSEKRKNIMQLMKTDRELGQRLLKTWERERRDKAKGLDERDILIRNMGIDDRVDFLSRNPAMINEFRKKGMLTDSVINALRQKGAM